MLIKLILAHLLGDFLFQSKLVVIWKNKLRAGSTVHYLIVYGASLLVFAPDLGKPGVLAGLTVMALIHGAIDEAKIALIKKWPYRDGLGVFLFDQFLHYLVMGGVAWYWETQKLTGPGLIQERVGLWLIVAVGCSYFVSILLFYVRRLTDKGAGYRRDYREMLYRLCVGLLGWVFYPAALVLTGWFWWRNRAKAEGRVGLIGNLVSLALAFGASRFYS